MSLAVWREVWTVAARPYLLHRAALAVVVVLGAELVGVARTWHALPSAPFFDAWLRWDSFYYLMLAAEGYGSFPWGTANSFFPLYAWLIRGLGWVVGRPAAALLVSNGAAIAFLWLLHRWVLRRADAATARRTVRYAILFPTSYFLTAGYAESLLLCTVLGTHLAHEERRPGVALGLAALATLTKPVGGPLVAAPLVLAYALRPRREPVPWAPLLGTAVGAAAVLATYHAATGNPLAFLSAPQVEVLGRYTSGPGPSALAVLWDEGWSRNLVRRLLNASALCLALGALVHALRRREPAWALLVALSVGIPLAFQRTLLDAVSMARYLLVAYPVYLALARWAPGPDGRPLEFGLQMVQVVLAVLFGASLWVE